MTEAELDPPTSAQQVLEWFTRDLIARQVQRTEVGVTLQASIPLAGRLVADVRRSVLIDSTSFSLYLTRLVAELDRLILLPDAPRPAAEVLGAIDRAHAALVRGESGCRR